VKHSINCWGNGKYKIIKQRNAPHEAGLLRLNITKAKKQLGWQPRWNAKQAIEKTIIWYHESLMNKNVFEMCVRGIEEYEEW
jgi:CDP-glucose 4,6-dehydratase